MLLTDTAWFLGWLQLSEKTFLKFLTLFSRLNWCGPFTPPPAHYLLYVKWIITSYPLQQYIMLNRRPKIFSLHSHRMFFHDVWVFLIVLTSLTGHSYCSNSINHYVLTGKLYWSSLQRALQSEGETHSRAAHLPAERMQRLRVISWCMAQLFSVCLGDFHWDCINPG